MKNKREKKSSGKIEAPVVVHGATDKSQGEWMRDTMTETARKFTSTQNGKGSRNRTNISSKAWRDGYDNIDWGKK